MQFICLTDNQLSCNLIGVSVGCPRRNNNAVFIIEDLQLYACKRLILGIDLDDFDLCYLVPL